MNMKTGEGGTMTSGPRRQAEDLRSARWFRSDDLRSFGHRSRVLQMGYDYEELDVRAFFKASPCPLPAM